MLIIVESYSFVFTKSSSITFWVKKMSIMVPPSSVKSSMASRWMGKHFIFTKKVLLLEIAWYAHGELVNQYIGYGSKVHPGSFWVTAHSYGHKFIFAERTITCPCYMAEPWDSRICIRLDSSILWGQNPTWGHLASHGSKRSLSSKML